MLKSVKLFNFINLILFGCVSSQFQSGEFFNSLATTARIEELDFEINSTNTNHAYNELMKEIDFYEKWFIGSLVIFGIIGTFLLTGVIYLLIQSIHRIKIRHRRFSVEVDGRIGSFAIKKNSEISRSYMDNVETTSSSSKEDEKSIDDPEETKETNNSPHIEIK